MPGRQAHRELLADQRDGRPGLVCFSTCKHAIRTILARIHDTTNVEDVQTDSEGHAPDDGRYFAMSLADRCREGDGHLCAVHDWRLRAV